MTVVGARPQFVKAAVVSAAFREKRPSVEEILVHTGQHYDKNMSEVFFEELNIRKPDYNIGVGGGSHAQNTGRMMIELEKIAIELRPDWMIVYGDTDSTLAGALTAAKMGIRIAHIEAGLRSWNRAMPEEINRVVTDHVSDHLFAPTTTAVSNLLREGVDTTSIDKVGDVMFDTMMHFSGIARARSSIRERLSINDGEFALVTVHRADNTASIARIRTMLTELGELNMPVVWPVHPRTKKLMMSENLDVPANIRMIEPVGYLDMLVLEASCAIVVTDSGGVQKEAYFHEVPCVVLRSETEWTELVDCGAVVLADVAGLGRTARDSIARSYDSTPRRGIYGNGDAASKIAMHAIFE